MIFIIPTQQGASAYQQRVVLDGRAYLLDFAWNGRVSAWYLSIYDSAGAPLLMGRKLSTNCRVLERFRFVPGLPPGELMACDPTALIEYADYGQLGPGLGVELVYFDAQELTGPEVGGAQ